MYDLTYTIEPMNATSFSCLPVIHLDDLVAVLQTSQEGDLVLVPLDDDAVGVVQIHLFDGLDLPRAVKHLVHLHSTKVETLVNN